MVVKKKEEEEMMKERDRPPIPFPRFDFSFLDLLFLPPHFQIPLAPSPCL